MKKIPIKIAPLLYNIFILFVFFSCNKDSDLLSDYISEETLENIVEVVEEKIVVEINDIEDIAIETKEDVVVNLNIANVTVDKKRIKRIKTINKPINANTTILDDRTLIFTPNNDYNGTINFEFIVEIVNDNESITEETVNVNIVIEPVADVVDDHVRAVQNNEVEIDVLRNDTFKDKNSVRILTFSETEKGSVVISENKILKYTPTTSEEETETFTYTAEITNADNTVTVEEGNITVVINSTDESTPIGGELKAFPSAIGFGKFTTGGRGGEIIHVTNLNASGTGSFKEAVTGGSNRIIVFDIGGTIDLGGEVLKMNKNNITILGQSAPANSGGITIKGSVRCDADNIIIRYMRFRLSSNAVGSEQDSFAFFHNQNAIIDHCSISWGVDETFNIAGSADNIAKNITVSNCIIGQSFGKGVLFYLYIDNVTMVNNYHPHVRERNYRSRQLCSFEMINNLFYNPGYLCLIDTGVKFNAQNNHYQEGPNGFIGSEIFDHVTRTGFNQSDTEPFISGNTFSGSAKEIDSYFVADMEPSPTVSSGIIPMSIDNMIPYILENAGARYPYFDSIDTQLIADYNTGTGRWISNETSVGGYPNLATGTALLDSDNDGMPDAWEIANELNPDSDDSSGDSDGNGYTNIEEYMYSLTEN